MSNIKSGQAEIMQKLNDKSRRKKIGVNATETAKQYTWKHHLDKTEKLFNTLKQ